MGKEKGLNYFRQLAKQDLQLRTGHTLLTQLCIAGEFPIVVNAYGSRVEKEKARGAPAEWVGVEPIIFHANGIALGKKARHPNAAKLYIDFVLSEEGQKIYQKRGRIPCRNGVYPKVARLVEGLKLRPFNYALIAKKYSEIEDQWANILKGK
jgi:iron(III) transport system substrate-binding protein